MGYRTDRVAVSVNVQRHMYLQENPPHTEDVLLLDDGHQVQLYWVFDLL